MSEHSVMVGETCIAVTEDEWLIASSPAGTRLRVTPRRGAPFVMVLEGSMFYDGLSAWGYEPDPDERIERSVYPAMGDRVERCD